MNVLVVVAHPDDEVLGVGGTAARLTQAGEQVYILIIADGESSRSNGDNLTRTAITVRASAAECAARVLGARPPQLLGYPDNRLDSIPLLDIVKQVEAVIEELGPEIIFTHHPYDLNIDHQIVASAVMTACRPVPNAIVRTIYAFETPSSTEWTVTKTMNAFVPRRIVEITSTLSTKIAALRCYHSEMRPFPHARSYEGVEALARWRGVSAGFVAAEAFDILREIIPI